MKAITRQGEQAKAQRKLLADLLAESLKQTAEGMVADYDPALAEAITRQMTAAGQLVPVGYGQNVRGLSFMPVDFKSES